MAGVAYVLVIPVFSAFRLELVSCRWPPSAWRSALERIAGRVVARPVSGPSPPGRGARTTGRDLAQVRDCDACEGEARVTPAQTTRPGLIVDSVDALAPLFIARRCCWSALLLLAAGGAGAGAQRALHASSRRPTRPVGDAVEDSPARGRHEVPLRRGRLHHGAALLQAGEQHRHRTSATCGRRRGTQLARGHVRGRDRLGLAGGRAAPTPVPITADTTYVVSYHSSSGRFGFSPGVLHQPPSTRGAAARARRRHGGNGVYRYGARGFPDRDLERDELLGRRRRSSTTPPATRTAPRVSSTDARRRRDRRAGADATVDAPRSTRPIDAATVDRRRLRARDGSGTAVPASVSLRRGTRKATLTPTAAARLRPDLHRDGQGRRRGRRPTPPATGSPPTASWSFTDRARLPVHGLRRRPTPRSATPSPTSRSRSA